MRDKSKDRRTDEPFTEDASESYEVPDLDHDEVIFEILETPPDGPGEEPEPPPRPRSPEIPEGEDIPDRFDIAPTRLLDRIDVSAAIEVVRSARVWPAGPAYSYVNEPSVARKGNVVFYTGNWYAALSRDGGDTWAFIDPYKAFNPQTGEPGFCCDQVVVYVPQIDMFVWSLQSKNFALQRILYASPADVVQGRWKRFTLTPQNLGVPGGDLDFVDMAVGSGMVYWTCNVFNVATNAVAVRIPHDSLRRGAPAPQVWKSGSFSLRLAQGCDDVAYFAAHQTKSALRIYAWPESVNAPTAHVVSVPTWQRISTSVTWLQSNDSRILGGARIGAEVWFAWTVNSRTGRPYPFVQIARVDTQRFTYIGSADVWQQMAAVGYAALASNRVTNEVGISYTVGTNAPSFAVGILTGTPVHLTVVQGSATSVNRWGDYLTIRQDYDDNAQPIRTFAAAGYVRDAAPRTQPRFVEFATTRMRDHVGPLVSDRGGDVDAITRAAEHLLTNVVSSLKGDADASTAAMDLGLIEFELTVAGVTVKLKVASKECCKT